MGSLTGGLQFFSDVGTLSEERPQRWLDESGTPAQKRRIDPEFCGDRHVGTAPLQEGAEFGLGQAEPVHRGNVEVPYPSVVGGVQDRSPRAALRNPEQACATKAYRGGRDASSRQLTGG